VLPPAARYRSAFDQVKELRGALEAALEGLAAAKASLITAFDAWAAANSNSSSWGTGRRGQVRPRLTPWLPCCSHCTVLFGFFKPAQQGLPLSMILLLAGVPTPAAPAPHKPLKRATDMHHLL
jgi:hypothetical protein